MVVVVGDVREGGIGKSSVGSHNAFNAKSP